MINALQNLFRLNACLFVFFASLAICCGILKDLHWIPNYSFRIDWFCGTLSLAIFFRFNQLNLRLFPKGLELDFWKEVGKSFPRLRKGYLCALLISQLSLLWWTPVLTHIPAVLGTITAYFFITCGNIEIAERVYSTTHENEGSSFSAISTYALVDRRLRRAEDPRIDKALKAVYGENSAQMSERKRLLADYLMLTKGNVPLVSKLRAEARKNDPHKYIREVPFYFHWGEKFYFYNSEKYQHLADKGETKEFKNQQNQNTGGLIGAPVDPRYGQIWVMVPRIHSFSYPKESNGQAETTLWAYTDESQRRLRSNKSDNWLAIAFLLFLPASFVFTCCLKQARKRVLDYFSRRWRRESLSHCHWQLRIDSLNRLIILERLRKDYDKANEYSLKLMNLVSNNPSI